MEKMEKKAMAACDPGAVIIGQNQIFAGTEGPASHEDKMPLKWIRAGQVLLLVGVALYVGGMMALGAIAAPEIFSTLRRSHASTPEWQGLPDAAQQLGGEVFGNVLQRFAFMEWACLGLMLAGMLLQLRWPRWKGCWGAARWGLLAVLLLLAGYDQALLTPAVWHQRTVWRQSLRQDPAAAEGHRATFDALHRRSEMLGQAKVYLLLAMLGLVAWRSVPAGSAQPSHAGA